MNEIKVFPIGKIENAEPGFRITLDPEYKDGRKTLQITAICRFFGGSTDATIRRIGKC